MWLWGMKKRVLLGGGRHVAEQGGQESQLLPVNPFLTPKFLNLENRVALFAVGRQNLFSPGFHLLFFQDQAWKSV